MKDVFYGDKWNSASHWISKPFKQNENDLREPILHARLSAAGAKHCIVEYRGHAAHDERHLLRLYMEYCPLGDLRELLCSHAKFDLGNQCDMRDANNDEIPGMPIPPRALWEFFKGMAEAACILAGGNTSKGSSIRSDPDWQVIVHRDLKPSNIFLSLPLASNGGDIPIVKVGDFGISVPEDYEALENPYGMVGAGTRGWKAPEFHRYYGDDDVPHHPLTSATDVWAIGRIMLALIELTPGVGKFKQLPDVQYNDDANGEVVHSKERPHLVKRYGKRMYELVDRCLRPQPDDRISADKLYKEIKQHLDETDSPLDRNGKRLSPQLAEDEYLMHRTDMRWAK